MKTVIRYPIAEIHEVVNEVSVIASIYVGFNLWAEQRVRLKDVFAKPGKANAEHLKSLLTEAMNTYPDLEVEITEEFPRMLGVFYLPQNQPSLNQLLVDSGSATKNRI